MSLEYLEDLEKAIEHGREYFACPGKNSHEWHISNEPESLNDRCQRTANMRKFPQHVYQLVNVNDAGAGDSYLICKKLLDAGPRGEANLHWMLVDTKDAAEMLRDVSQGPSPYFGAVPIAKFDPTI